MTATATPQIVRLGTGWAVSGASCDLPHYVFQGPTKRSCEDWVTRSHQDALDRVGAAEVDRLMDLALDEPYRRRLWATRAPDGYIAPQRSEETARRIVAGWDPSRGPIALMHRDVPGGEWTEVPLVSPSAG